ncbi:hypothetical protein SNE40_021499 [Patella caerulea]|uniref:Uncharacterized protein n=1 Tax=Patella caerulea TaxID=87958 RepID=A0AAN8FZT1_PATCE
MFKASDRIDYERLKVNPPSNKDKPTKNKVKPLVLLSCKAINKWPQLAELAIETAPCHLAPTLLRAAIDNVQPAAVSCLIANWPLSDLCFREILYGDVKYTEIFQEEMGYDLVVFRGIVGRKKRCKIKCVDLRGFKLNAMFCKLIVKMWPILSLTKSQLNPKKLAKVIAQTAGVEASRLTDDILPNLLRDILEHEMIKNTNVRIALPRRQRMIVKLDSLLFLTGNTFFMDYLISNCLRHITPVYIQVSSLQIRSDLQIGEQILDSLAPFIVLRGQDTQTLDGICLSQLEENIFFTIVSDLQKFVNIRFLDIQECSIYLQKGKTRSRTQGRSKLVSLFSSMVNLKRLDISSNYVLGCLGEVLDALSIPLEYLNISGCDIDEDDLDSLSKSHHAKSLRELNASKLTHFSMFDISRVSQTYLLKTMRHFPNVCVLNLAENNLADAIIPEFCVTIKECLKYLKVLDLSANILNMDSLITITQTCAKLKSMQKILVTCANGLWDVALAPLDNLDHQQELKQKLLKVLEMSGRTDIIVEPVRLLRTLSIDFIDLLHGHLL